MLGDITNQYMKALNAEHTFQGRRNREGSGRSTPPLQIFAGALTLFQSGGRDPVHPGFPYLPVALHLLAQYETRRGQKNPSI